MIDFYGAAVPMTLDGLRQASNLLRCDAAAVLAVIEVETEGCGFLPDRRPRSLFERHVFRRETGGRFDRVAPDLSNPTPGEYGKAGAAQYDRLERAMALDERAALRATSWGLGQIMGFNAMAAGYDDAPDMVMAFIASENEELMAMARFICHQKLDAFLRLHKWTEFARGYNGPSYWQHGYQGRLEAAYSRHVNGRKIDMDLRAAQVRLMFAGLYRGRIDGLYGPITSAALTAARQNGIDVGYEVRA